MNCCLKPQTAAGSSDISNLWMWVFIILCSVVPVGDHTLRRVKNRCVLVGARTVLWYDNAELLYIGLSLHRRPILYRAYKSSGDHCLAHVEPPVLLAFSAVCFTAWVFTAAAPPRCTRGESGNRPLSLTPVLSPGRLCPFFNEFQFYSKLSPVRSPHWLQI